MLNTIKYSDLGLVEYSEMLYLQEKYFNNIISLKIKSGSNLEKSKYDNVLFLCQHPHVYTLGKNGEENNLLIDEEILKKINASFLKTNRGGDITYHGPGQIVGYPIFELEGFGIGVREYIYNIEEIIMLTLREYGINADRTKEAPGVWLDVGEKGVERKICAIGVRASRKVTMHGFAFNINTDLSYFNHINPCGFIDKGVTSLKKELGKEVNEGEVKSKLVKYFSQVFNTENVELLS